MLKDKFHWIIATGLGVGKIPFAPGTFGSLLAVCIWVIVNYYYFIFFNSFVANLIMWLAIIISTFFIGIKSAEFYCNKYQKKDAGEVVIDEFCGQWIAIFISCLSSGVIGYKMQTITKPYFISILLSFILFRFFDIFKPWLIGKADKNVSGGLGVMLDDVLAGIFAGLTFVLFKIVFSF